MRRLVNMSFADMAEGQSDTTSVFDTILAAITDECEGLGR